MDWFEKLTGFRETSYESVGQLCGPGRHPDASSRLSLSCQETVRKCSVYTSAWHLNR